MVIIIVLTQPSSSFFFFSSFCINPVLPSSEINTNKHAGKDSIKHIRCESLSKSSSIGTLKSSHYLGINGVACLSAALNQPNAREYFSEILKSKTNFTLESFELAQTKMDMLRTLLSETDGLSVNADLESRADGVVKSILQDEKDNGDEDILKTGKSGDKTGKSDDHKKNKGEEASRKIDKELNATMSNSTGPLRSGDSVCRSLAAWLMSKPKQSYIDAANKYKQGHVYQCRNRQNIDVAIQYRMRDDGNENKEHLDCTSSLLSLSLSMFLALSVY